MVLPARNTSHCVSVTICVNLSRNTAATQSSERNVCSSSNSPCLNGGLCSLSSGSPGYVCKCSAGYVGRTCQQGTDCLRIYILCAFVCVYIYVCVCTCVLLLLGRAYVGPERNFFMSLSYTYRHLVRKQTCPDAFISCAPTALTRSDAGGAPGLCGRCHAAGWLPLRVRGWVLGPELPAWYDMPWQPLASRSGTCTTQPRLPQETPAPSDDPRAPGMEAVRHVPGACGGGCTHVVRRRDGLRPRGQHAGAFGG